MVFCKRPCAFVFSSFTSLFTSVHHPYYYHLHFLGAREEKKNITESKWAVSEL